MALGAINTIAGEGGLAKSILTNACITAAVTRGTLEGDLYGEPVDVLIANAEDSWGAVITPRLLAHGADLDRVHRIEVTDSNGESTLSIPRDVPTFEQAIERLADQGRRVGLVWIDPIGAFWDSSIDTHKEGDVRGALHPLANLAEQADVAIGLIAHLSKDENRRMVNRITGSIGVVNASRSVLGLARHPDDAEGEAGSRRVLLHVKTNWGTYAPSLEATVESREIRIDDGSVAEVGYFRLGGETEVGVEDLQREAAESGDDRREAIIAALDSGPRPSRDVKGDVARELGCSRKTVQRAAMAMRDDGELKVEESGFPRTTTWTLASPHAAASESGTNGDGSSGDRPRDLRMSLLSPHCENGSGKPNPPAGEASEDTEDGSQGGVPADERREAWKATR